ncbi:MAG: glycosyltransferase family 2 protein, partial [Oscillospiraceae bacterium]|nr:glycosyltransferase family 2 protein [Oscillospiraceae bacterium]
MTQPKVSVIIPVYNTEKYLRECLDSVINQTLTDIEIICVDDASTDSSPEILAEYAAADSRITVITHEVNKKQAAVKKTAVARATGKYIWFVDSDDTISLNGCEKAFELAQKQKVDILHFNMDIVNAGNLDEAMITD